MPTKMYINTSNIKFNIEQIKAKLPKNTNIIAMVKANAYGLGDVQMCKYLSTQNIKFFGVALVREAVHLRKNNITDNILVTSQFLDEDMQNILKYKLTVSCSNLDSIKKLNEIAKKKETKVNIHVKIDTGMTRLGFSSLKAENVVNYINKNLKNINIEGIYTHLSSADTDREYTLDQLHKFEILIQSLKSNGLKFKYIHALNSSGVINFPEFSYNTVRVGDILYGYYPDESLRKKITLKPCVKITSPVVDLREVGPGCSVSYSRKYITDKNTCIATLQIGYADGLDRKLSNHEFIKINGIKRKILGTICMDMCMIEINSLDEVKIGQECTIIDYDDSIYDICNILDTINYEIIARFSIRVKRIYE